MNWTTFLGILTVIICAVGLVEVAAGVKYTWLWLAPMAFVAWGAFKVRPPK